MPTTAAILISRQSRYPDGSTGWVRHAALAVDWIRHRGYTLVSSVGLQTWEMITSLGSLARLPMHLHVPCGAHDDPSRIDADITAQFALDRRLVSFRWVTVDSTAISKHELLQTRDRSVIGAADFLLPVAVRTGGSIESHIATRRPDQLLDRSFHYDGQDRSTVKGYVLEPDRLDPAVESAARGFLIHWTRTSNGPWPGERAVDYYRDVVHSTCYPRSALDTLLRIAHSRLLRPSARHMPGNTPTVSLSGLSPNDAVPLMRWRTRYGQMSFEPYGIGIRESAARRLSVVPVTYYDADNRPTGLRGDTWMTQSRGRITDWRNENEYRHRGDLNFSDLEPSDLRLFCRRPAEVPRLHDATGIDTYALFSE
ncbi:MAG: hypothetical protein RBT76_07930 [candidate division Zixibacteria bacterium]|nr:hypothetical protein [candidate division Zixibacteria bacterium]